MLLVSLYLEVAVETLCRQLARALITIAAILE